MWIAYTTGDPSSIQAVGSNKTGRGRCGMHVCRGYSDSRQVPLCLSIAEVDWILFHQPWIVSMHQLSYHLGNFHIYCPHAAAVDVLGSPDASAVLLSSDILLLT